MRLTSQTPGTYQVLSDLRASLLFCATWEAEDVKNSFVSVDDKLDLCWTTGQLIFVYDSTVHIFKSTAQCRICITSRHFHDNYRGDVKVTVNSLARAQKHIYANFCPFSNLLSMLTKDVTKATVNSMQEKFGETKVARNVFCPSKRKIKVSSLSLLHSTTFFVLWMQRIERRNQFCGFFTSDILEIMW